MLGTIIPSYRGAGQDGGSIELPDGVLIMYEFPTAHPSSVFAGVVLLHPPDEMICCDMTVPARPCMEGRVPEIDTDSQLPKTWSGLLGETVPDTFSRHTSDKGDMESLLWPPAR